MSNKDLFSLNIIFATMSYAKLNMNIEVSELNCSRFFKQILTKYIVKISYVAVVDIKKSFLS